jgi:sterol 3beta-glucosyltransferase
MAATELKRIMIVSAGSRGDIQPFIAFGLALQRAHYDVAVLSHEIFRQFVAEQAPSLAFHGIAGDPSEMLHSDAGVRLVYEGSGSDMLTMMLEEGKKHLEPNFNTMHRFASDWKPHMLISSITEMAACVAVAEIAQIPMLIAATLPIYPSEYHAPIMMRARPFAFRWMNRAYVCCVPSQNNVAMTARCQ